MPNYKSSYRTALDTPSLHTLPNQRAINKAVGTAKFPDYTIAGTETTNEYIRLGPLFKEGAQFLEGRVRLPAHASAFINAAGKIGKYVNTLQEAKSGTWARSSTTATVTTTTPHNLLTGQTLIAITESSDTAAITNSSVTVTVLTPYTFTFTCLNAGGTSGTLKFAEGVGSIGYFTGASNVQSASSGTAAGAGSTVTFSPSAGEVPTLNADDDLIFTFTGATDIDAGRVLQFEVDYADPL